jgi:hypothetical protein
MAWLLIMDRQGSQDRNAINLDIERTWKRRNAEENARRRFDRFGTRFMRLSRPFIAGQDCAPALTLTFHGMVKYG